MKSFKMMRKNIGHAVEHLLPYKQFILTTYSRPPPADTMALTFVSEEISRAITWWTLWERKELTYPVSERLFLPLHKTYIYPSIIMHNMHKYVHCGHISGKRRAHSHILTRALCDFYRFLWIWGFVVYLWLCAVGFWPWQVWQRFCEVQLI